VNRSQVRGIHGARPVLRHRPQVWPAWSTATTISTPSPTTSEFEFRYHFPGWPQTLSGRDALMALYAGYGNNIVLHGADEFVVHRSQDPRVVINVTIEGRKIVKWRDYMDSLAAMTALSQVQ